jgi:hypothetical protein
VQDDPSQITESLTTRLTASLAATDISQFTIRQLREFVRREVEAAVGAATKPASPPEAPPPALLGAEAAPKSPPIEPAAAAPEVLAVERGPAPASDAPALASPVVELAASAEVLVPAPTVKPVSPDSIQASAPQVAALTAPQPAAVPAAAPGEDEEEGPPTTVKVMIGPIVLVLIVLLLVFLFLRDTLGGGAAPAPAPANQPRQNAPAAQVAEPAKPALQQPPAAQPASLAGMTFRLQKIIQGSTSSQPYEASVGTVTVKDGALSLVIAGVPGYDGAYDYLRLVDGAGKEARYEAEDAAITTGDAYSANDGLDDNHWWRQEYGGFSAGRALLVRKNENAPPLSSAIKLADGEYRLFVGSFTGDPANGVFALSVNVK